MPRRGGCNLDRNSPQLTDPLTDLYPPSSVPSPTSTVFNMCTQKAPHNWSGKLYVSYQGALEKYLSGVVCPAIEAKNDPGMLKELGQRWDNHQVMVRWLSRLFTYIDRFYVKRLGFPSLSEIGVRKFRDLVFNKVKPSLQRCFLQKIDRERNGGPVDYDLLKKIVQLQVLMGRSRDMDDDDDGLSV